MFPLCKSCQKPLQSYIERCIEHCLACHKQSKSNHNRSQSAQKKKKSENSIVYFIQAIDSGIIKIGQTTDIGKRLAALQTGCPEQLTVLKTMPGDKSIERLLHKKFSAANKQGEWFYPTDELLKYIGSL